MILHIVSKSPFSHPALSLCLASIQNNDAMILTEDGVYALMDKNLSVPQTIGVYALTQDVKARGVEAWAGNTKLVDYADFVDLVAGAEKSVSWF